MKKKILTILCAICLILPCAFVFSGCDADKYAGQITQIETQVGNLTNSLEETSNNLSEVSDTLDKMQKELSIDEAYGLYTLAMVRISLGTNGIWDNFRMNVTATHTETDHPSFELDESTAYYELILYKGTTDSVCVVYDANYDDGSINYAYKSDVTQAGEYSYTYFLNEMLADFGFVELTSGFVEESIVSVEALDNGNYMLYAVKQLAGEEISNNYLVYEVEITRDGLLVCLNTMFYDEFGPSTSEGLFAVCSVKVEFSYGDVTQAEVDALVNTPGAHPYPSFA